MMAWAYSQRSLSRLSTCDHDLQLLFLEALKDPACPYDITIIEGHRTEDRQNQMVAEGKSQLRWPRSRHNSLPSMAVDVAPFVGGSISWSWDHYNPLADHVKAVWSRLKAEGKVHGTLVWGGDWASLRDGPHFQIDR